MENFRHNIDTYLQYLHIYSICYCRCCSFCSFFAVTTSGVTIIFGPAGKHSLRALVHLWTSNAMSNRQSTALQNVSVYRVRHTNSETFALSPHWPCTYFISQQTRNPVSATSITLVSVTILYPPVPPYKTFLVMLMTHYLKRFWKTVIMFCTHIYQKKSINTIILGNAHVTKPSYLKQLT